MPFEKGHKRFGGRKKGQRNKQTQFAVDVINDLLTEYSESGDFADDWRELEPRDRISMAEKLMHYVLPKKSSVDASVTRQEDTSVIEWLKELSNM